jgi:hypothetical protein
MEGRRHWEIEIQFEGLDEEVIYYILSFPNYFLASSLYYNN